MSAAVSTIRHVEGFDVARPLSIATLVFLMLPLVLNNIDHSFATAHGIGNVEYVLAEYGARGLVCVLWGQHILDGRVPKA